MHGSNVWETPFICCLKVSHNEEKSICKKSIKNKFGNINDFLTKPQIRRVQFRITQAMAFHYLGWCHSVRSKILPELPGQLSLHKLIIQWLTHSYCLGLVFILGLVLTSPTGAESAGVLTEGTDSSPSPQFIHTAVISSDLDTLPSIHRIAKLVQFIFHNPRLLKNFWSLFPLPS